MALFIEPAADFGAALPDEPVAPPAAPLALANTLVASLNALAEFLEAVVAAEVADVDCGPASPWCNAKVATTARIAPTDACHGRTGRVAKRGILRSRGSITTRAASVVREPAKNQNNGMEILRNVLYALLTGRSLAARFLLRGGIVIPINYVNTMCANRDTFAMRDNWGDSRILEVTAQILGSPCALLD
ncbi:MAG TPA: hypothetical protein VII35_10930 [Steroidobacteraceae bacterium]